MSKPFYKNTNFIILFVMITLLVLRFLFPKDIEEEKKQQENVQEDKGLRHVRMETFNIDTFDYQIRLFSESTPVKSTELSSKYKGDIADIFVNEGDFVEEGQKIIRVQDNGLEAALNSANLALEEAKLNLESAKLLREKGLTSQLDFINKQTEFKRALSNKQSAQNSFEDAFVTANFSGVIENFDWNIGDDVKENQIIATLSDTSQIKSFIKIPENYISHIDLNNSVFFQFKDYKLPATFTHISKVGDLSTHTFGARIVSEKRDNLKSGISTPIFISIGEYNAYNIPLSLISMHKDNLNLKTVENDKVVNIPIKILTNSENGVWVTGIDGDLPNSINIITVGHLLVLEGDTVKSTLLEKE